MSIQELMDSNELRDQWGIWTFDAEALLIEDRTNGVAIDLSEIDTSAELLDWIFQIQGKSTYSPQDRSDLLAAFEEVLQPQKNYCFFGMHQAASGKALAQEYARHLREGKEREAT